MKKFVKNIENIGPFFLILPAPYHQMQAKIKKKKKYWSIQLLHEIYPNLFSNFHVRIKKHTKPLY